MAKTSMKKIGYVLKRFPRLSETFILNEILTLERNGFEVHIFSLLKPPTELSHKLIRKLNAEITYLPTASNLDRIKMHTGLEQASISFSDLACANSFQSQVLFPGKSALEIAAIELKAMVLSILCKQHQIQHLHAHFGSDATTVAHIAAKAAGIGYSFTAHARDIYHTYTSQQSDNAMRAYKISSSEFVVTVSDYNQNHLSKICPDARAKIHRIYNGVDLAKFAPNREHTRCNNILAVGRLVEKKGFSVLVEACAHLKSQGIDFDCNIVGDGPLREDLSSQIRSLNLSDSVTLSGAMIQEQLIGIMRKATVMVLPCIVSNSGDRDGLPTVLLEAMATGIPVVTTTVSGGPEIVRDGENGYLVEPGDSRALAKQISQILNDTASAKTMGRASRLRTEELFSLEQNVGVLAELFRTTINSSTNDQRAFQ